MMARKIPLRMSSSRLNIKARYLQPCQCELHSLKYSIFNIFRIRNVNKRGSQAYTYGRGKSGKILSMFVNDIIKNYKICRKRNEKKREENPNPN